MSISLPAAVPGRSATPEPPIPPSGFPAMPPVTLPTHTGSPAEAQSPTVTTTPAEPMEDEFEGYGSLSQDEIEDLLPYWVNRGGETAATKFGKEVHRNFDPGPGFKKEAWIGETKLRADGFNETERIVAELKPDTTRQVSKGTAQLKNYLLAAQAHYKTAFTGELVLYDPVTGLITRRIAVTVPPPKPAEVSPGTPDVAPDQ